MNSESLWLNYKDKNIWHDLLFKLPDDKRDVYYQPDYAALYADNSMEVNCYAHVNKDKVYLYPFIQRPVPKIAGYFDITTPYGYGGPISNCDDYNFLYEACRNFNGEAKKRNIIAEVIKFHPLLDNHLYLQNIYTGTIKKACATVYVEIDIDEEYRWRQIYTHANRKNINKARRNNITVKFGQDNEMWQAFTHLYNDTMRANSAGEFYYFSHEYFENIQKYLIDNYILVSCSIAGRIIAVMLVLLGKVYAHCHLIGTERDIMSTGVNNFLHHELILWCKKKGYVKLLIGGGRNDDEDDLLLKFKKNFSDKTADLYVGENIYNPDIYNELCGDWSRKNPGKQISNRLLKYRLT